MALLYLVRHGQSPVNVSRTFSYRTVDPGLTELGLQQARAVARTFADKPIARVFSGPLQRAQHTARQSGLARTQRTGKGHRIAGAQPGAKGAAAALGRGLVGQENHAAGIILRPGPPAIRRAARRCAAGGW